MGMRIALGAAIAYSSQAANKRTNAEPLYSMGQEDSTEVPKNAVITSASGAVSSLNASVGPVENSLMLLRNLALALESASSPVDAARLFLNVALKLSRMDSGVVYLVGPESQFLYPACFEGFSDKFMAGLTGFDQTHPLWQTLAAGKSTLPHPSVFINPSAQAAEGICTVLILPLHHFGRVQACVLTAAHKREETGGENSGALEIAASLAAGAIAGLNAAIQCGHGKEEPEETLPEPKHALECVVAGCKSSDAEPLNQDARLEIIKNIALDIVAAKQPQAIAEAALDHILRHINCSHASVVEFDHGKQDAVFLAVRSSTPSKLSRNFAMDKNAFPLELLGAGQVCGSIHPSSTLVPCAIDRLLIQEGAQSHVIVPLRYKSELIGVLNLGSQAPGYFDATLVEAAVEAGLALSIAMRHTRMQRQTVKDAETKAILLHEMNHRVKNNLSAILGLLFGAKRAARMVQDARHVALIDNLIGRIQGLATSHRLLSAVQWAPLALEQLSRQVVLSCLHALAPGKNVVLDVPASDILVTSKSANSLALILSELATNTIRHSIADRATARISVKATMASGIALLEFWDDGPGYPEAVLKGLGLNAGLSLVQAIVRNDLRGTIAFQNDGGATARIRFKPDDPNSKQI